MDGLLKDKLQEDKVQTRIEKYRSTARKCRGLANSKSESAHLEPDSRSSSHQWLKIAKVTERTCCFHCCYDQICLLYNEIIVQSQHGYTNRCFQKRLRAALGNQEIGGRWTDVETTHHINILELQAAFFALRAFCHTTNNTHVQLQTDNTTAVAYITNMGGSKSIQLNNLAKEMWTWCIHKNIWLAAVHIAGKLNTSADNKSRNFSDKHEWALSKEYFQEIVSVYPELNIDLFASRIFKPSANLLCHAHFKEPHPLHKSLHLMVCPLSGTPSHNKTFLRTLPTSSWPPGGKKLKTSTKPMWKNGWHFVVKGKSIRVLPR